MKAGCKRTTIYKLLETKNQFYKENTLFCLLILIMKHLICIINKLFILKTVSSTNHWQYDNRMPQFPFRNKSSKFCQCEHFLSYTRMIVLMKYYYTWSTQLHQDIHSIIRVVIPKSYKRSNFKVMPKMNKD